MPNYNDSIMTYVSVTNGRSEQQQHINTSGLLSGNLRCGMTKRSRGKEYQESTYYEEKKWLEEYNKAFPNNQKKRTV